ncbi:MAG: DHH family phosphoesterase [Lachnospiraceae bacterium]|nr:DHH family phosphoesterase [Lachnospiraceae bacterium]
MSFSLSKLTEYSNIVIQCHDNPDADALASGFALKWYLDKKKIPARFIYSGKNMVQKSNLVLMIKRLNIQVEYVTQLPKPELLVMVDCQYGQSNVTKFEADNIIVIDHHQVSGTLPTLSDVRSNYGSCSTVIYDLLAKEGIDINEDQDISTALYYGLLTDTNNFTEISHPVDKDLRDFAKFKNAEIILYRNSNLSIEELRMAGEALRNTECNSKYAYGIIETEPCDPNILGIISDMLLEVDVIGTCLVYNILPGLVKISVRSCIKEVKASELASYVASGYGGGGGHLVKAGGTLQRDLLERDGIEYTKEGLQEFFKKRMDTYYDTSKIMHVGTDKVDTTNMKHYRKKDCAFGYIKTRDFAEEGTNIHVRTLEGDVDITVSENVYIVIGIEGEIWPIKKQKFEASYRVNDEEYKFEGEYPPSVVDSEKGIKINLLPYARSCVASGGTGIYASKLDHRVKLFTTWDPDKYYLGVPGDYLAVRDDDPNDYYVIIGRIFPRTYEEA